LSLAPSLEAAYLRTTYWVDARPQPVALRVGESSVVLDRILARHRARRWAFITAWNPGSRRCSAWRNAAHQHQLLQALGRRGFRWLPGLGEGDDPRWPPEPSFLILGASVPEAKRLARRFNQYAIVVGKLGGPAVLVWCGDEKRDPKA
jgi:hypothetical protein